MPLGSGVAIKSKVNIIKNALFQKKKKVRYWKNNF